jgi:hypothetical protein
MTNYIPVKTKYLFAAASIHLYLKKFTSQQSMNVCAILPPSYLFPDDGRCSKHTRLLIGSPLRLGALRRSRP